MRAEHERYCYTAFKSGDVKYEKYKEAFDPKKFDGIAGEMIWHVFEAQGIDVSEVTGKKISIRQFWNSPKLLHFLKHAGFEEELEYRMVGICVRKSKIPKEEKRPPKPIKFRQRNNLIVPYIELFADATSLPIKSIIVGPCFDQKMQAEALHMVLEKEDLKVDVRLSEIPIPFLADDKLHRVGTGERALPTEDASKETVGAEKICMNVMPMPPSALAMLRNKHVEMPDGSTTVCRCKASDNKEH